MINNAKNQLLELLKNLGCSENCANFQSIHTSFSGFYSSTVRVNFPNGYVVQGVSESKGKPAAEIAAAQIVLNLIVKNYPEFLVNWDEIYVEAQAGDALIKLSIYLSTDLKSSDNKSKQLQSLESNFNLAKVFDHWKVQGDPELAIWGTNLSQERKATLVEALLWRRFNSQVLTIDASTKLQVLLSTLQSQNFAL